MFEDPEFTIDVMSEHYKQLHPNSDPVRDKKLLTEHFEELDEESEDAMPSDNSSSDGEFQEPKMYVAKDANAVKAYTEGKSLATERDMPLGQRSKMVGVRKRSHGSNNKEISFVPRLAPDGKKKKSTRGRRR